MASLYWDDFEKRTTETVAAIQKNINPPVRRVAVFITDRCNFRCKYCNHRDNGRTLSEFDFMSVLEKYGDTAIIHITGGEPSVVPWLYPFLAKHGNKYRFHLNTNAFIEPPASSVRRLKISLDHYDPISWDCLVGRSGAHSVVMNNIKKSIAQTVVSITYTLTRANYRNASSNRIRFKLEAKMTKDDLMKFCGKEDWHIGKYDTPWSDNKFSYASNGWLLVRVPKGIDIPPRKAPPVEKLPWLKDPARWYRVHNCTFDPNDAWRFRTQYGRAWFANCLLSLIYKLPNCQIGPLGIKEPARFKFDGGDGIIMPMLPR